MIFLGTLGPASDFKAFLQKQVLCAPSLDSGLPESAPIFLSVLLSTRFVLERVFQFRVVVAAGLGSTGARDEDLY